MQRAGRGSAGAGRLAPVCLNEHGVIVVLENQVFFGREVAEEGALRHVGSVDDLLDGGGFIAALVKQSQRVALDGGTGLRLLSFA